MQAPTSDGLTQQLWHRAPGQLSPRKQSRRRSLFMPTTWTSGSKPWVWALKPRAPSVDPLPSAWSGLESSAWKSGKGKERAAKGVWHPLPSAAAASATHPLHNGEQRDLVAEVEAQEDGVPRHRSQPLDRAEVRGARGVLQLGRHRSPGVYALTHVRLVRGPSEAVYLGVPSESCLHGPEVAGARTSG